MMQLKCFLMLELLSVSSLEITGKIFLNLVVSHRIMNYWDYPLTGSCAFI